MIGLYTMLIFGGVVVGFLVHAFLRGDVDRAALEMYAAWEQADEPTQERVTELLKYGTELGK
jgi:hypothetical protein